MSLSIPQGPEPLAERAAVIPPVLLAQSWARAFSAAHNEPHPPLCKLLRASPSPWEAELFKQAAHLPPELLQHGLKSPSRARGNRVRWQHGSLAPPGQNGGSKPPLFLPCKWENYATWLWPKNQYLLLNYRNKWQLWWPITNWWLFLCSVSPSVKPTAKGQENMTDLSAIKNFLVSFVGAHLFMALCQSK